MKQLDKSLAPALQNGLSVLELLATEQEDVGFNYIASHLGVSKSTTSRLLTVLRERNYIVKDEKSGKYRPGSRMSFFNQSLPIIELLRRELPATLDSLMDATSNTVLFIFWNGNELQCLDKKTHQGSVPMQEIGYTVTNLTSGPWGWLVYDSLDKAGQKNAELNMASELNFKKISPRWKNYFKQNNFCYDDQELYPPLRRLAVPIYDHNNNLIGSLAIGGNSLTIKDNKVLDIGKILVDHGKMLMEKIKK
jgi:IclR family transcriptional regulator, KDG regulon repressor